MSARRREVALLLALAALAALLALVPDGPVARLAAYEGDGPEPRYDADVDAAAIRRAGELVPDDATYVLLTPGATPLLAGNVKAAAQLFLSPALPVRDPAAAGWVLRYGDGELPPGLRTGAPVELGPGIALLPVRR